MAVCTTVLPVVGQDFCAPEINYGQIEQFFFTRQGDGLTDVTDDAEWTTRLSNTTTLPSAGTDAPIRAIDVIGDWPAPDVTETVISRNRRVYSRPAHTINLRVDHTNAANYAFAKTMLGTTQTYSCWFIADGLIFGGDTGLTCDMTVTGYTIPESRTEIQQIIITIKWEGAMPDRDASPF
jgi:hypothetical protein